MAESGFQLYVVKEYQRLKELESNTYNLEWNVRRILSKTNYHLHTDAIKEYVLPASTLPRNKQSLLYAEEADILNLALFGCTAKEWGEANPKRVLAGENIRDMASINELTILSNLEHTNALLLKQGIDKTRRFHMLQEIAQEQKQRLDQLDLVKAVKRTTPEIFLGLEKPKSSLFVSPSCNNIVKTSPSLRVKSTTALSFTLTTLPRPKSRAAW